MVFQLPFSRVRQGTQAPEAAANAALVLTFSVVIVLIADLDAPQGGFLQVSQQPILDVIDKMNAPVP